MNLPGVAWIVGCPQSGKTTYAKACASETSKARGWPVCIVDPAQVHNFAEVPLHTVDEAISALWRNPRGNARVLGTGNGEMDRLCRAVRHGKRVVLLVDEAHYFLSAQSGVSGELLRLMRATQHAEADLILTTQHLTGDVHQMALGTTARLAVFRCTSPRVLDTLERSFQAPREVVRSLAQFQCLQIEVGFR